MSCLTLVVAGHRGLLAGRVGIRRGQAHRIAGCSLAARSLVARRHSSLGWVVAAGDSRVVGIRPGRTLAVGGMGSVLGVGTAGAGGSPGCTDRRGRTLRL